MMKEVNQLLLFLMICFTEIDGGKKELIAVIDKNFKNAQPGVIIVTSICNDEHDSKYDK
jgi:hypothetical protein